MENFMTHCPTEDVLLDYISGSLEPAKAAMFERHADQCAHCAALRTAQAAVWRSMDEWKPAPVSEGFNRELWRRIDAEPEASAWMFRFSFWKQLAPLAVAMALVVTAFVFDHSTRQPLKPASASAVIVTVSEADQIERALDDIQLLEAADTSVAVKPGAGVM